MKHFDPEPKPGEPLGDYVRRVRIHRGWSQQTLAEKIGSSREYVSQIELGNRKWPKLYANALATALGVRLSWIGRAAGRIVSDTDDIHADETLRTAERELPEEVFALWARMGAEDRDIALSWLRRLARPAPTPTDRQEDHEPVVVNDSA